MYIQPFNMEVDWQEIWHYMDVSTMFHICRYCFLLVGQRWCRFPSILWRGGCRNYTWNTYRFFFPNDIYITHQKRLKNTNMHKWSNKNTSHYFKVAMNGLFYNFNSFFYKFNSFYIPTTLYNLTLLHCFNSRSSKLAYTTLVIFDHTTK